MNFSILKGNSGGWARRISYLLRKGGFAKRVAGASGFYVSVVGVSNKITVCWLCANSYWNEANRAEIKAKEAEMRAYLESVGLIPERHFYFVCSKSLSE